MTVRVVFDTSCLISAALRPFSVPDQAVTLTLDACHLCASIGGLEELETVLHRRRFDPYVDLDSRIAFLETIRSHSQVFTLTEALLSDVKGCCRDANDDFILALAFSARASVIVSSDQDLLVMHPWRGIPIVTPGQFLTQYGE